VRPLRFAAAATVAAAAALVAHAAAADEPEAIVEGVDNTRLRGAIQDAIGGTENPPGSRFEARRRARAAAEQAIDVLRSEGYYQYLVEPDVADGDTPQARVRVTPGPRFGFAKPGVDWIDGQPVAEARIAGESSIGLLLGSPGRAAEVLSAEGRILAAVQARGYADAAAQPREVIVDHAQLTVQPTFRIKTGDRVRMDGVNVVSRGRTNNAWVAYLAPWTSGEVYDPEDVAELERRLLDTGVYDAVTVSLAPTSNAEGLRPVLISLSDRPRATVELGASYSTAEGAGLDGRYTRFNRLGRADTWRVQGQFAQIQQRLETELALPHWRRPAMTLKLGAAVYRDDTDAYEETGALLRVDIERRIGKTDFRTYGITAGVSRDEERVESGGAVIPRRRELATVAGLVAWSIDRSNDPLNPVRGWRLEWRGEPIAHSGDDTLAYLRAQAQGSLYIPFDEKARTVAAARLKLGGIVGGRIPEVPASRRFYAGGGGSVRGYAYQAVGPRFSDNTPQGGLSLIEGSLEVRRQVVGAWTGVAFIDAGILGDRSAIELDDPAVGVGVGVRYDLGFAPLRVDIGVPLNKREGDSAFQVYLSVGQSF
jgi:translocation and assembly module TamA